MKVSQSTRVVVVVQDYVHSIPEPIAECSFRSAQEFIAEIAREDHANFTVGMKRPQYATITVRRLSDGANLDRHIFGGCRDEF